MTQLPEYDGLDRSQHEQRDAVGFAVQYALIDRKQGTELAPPENNEVDAADQSVIPPHAPHVTES